MLVKLYQCSRRMNEVEGDACKRSPGAPFMFIPFAGPHAKSVLSYLFMVLNGVSLLFFTGVKLLLVI